jgi:hypothetical protein
MNHYKNWINFSFENGSQKKENLKSTLAINVDIPDNILNISYKDALYRNASLMRDSFSEPFDVLLSGGIDSEVIVRVFKDLGIKHNTFIFKYEDDLNVRDVNSAVDICNSLNINYKLIDFNLKKFYESSEAADIFEKTLIPAASGLSRIKWLDYLDNIPINGEGEPYWRRELKGDYSQKSVWNYELNEFFLFYSLNQQTLNRTIIGEWYLYTPEITMSHFNHPLIKKLLSDQTPRKESSISSKLILHREIWPEIKTKEKLTGYEGPTGSTSWNNVPPYFKDFSDRNEKIKITKNTKILYPSDNFEKVFLPNKSC